jgi:hypothetical protein
MTINILRSVALAPAVPQAVGAASQAQTNRQSLVLPSWSAPASGQLPNERRYFPEFLPALFERTLASEDLPAARGFEWVFTGLRAGLYLSLSSNSVALWTHFHDSPGFNLPVDSRRHNFRPHPLAARIY